MVPAILALFLINSAVTAWQDGADERRGLKPREYAERLQQQLAKQRPQATQARKKTPVTYVAKARDENPVGEGVDIGLTFWRLREAVKTDAVAVQEQTRKVVRVKDRFEEKLVKVVPTRADSDNTFANGDNLRLSLEVPFQAYVYVFNREQYLDGTLGEPYLIYPGVADARRSEAGRLIYIPSEPYNLEITPNDAGKAKAAEVFVVLLTQQPLAELPPLKADEENRPVGLQQFARWQTMWGGQVWRFEQQGSQGGLITAAEKQAGKTSGALLTGDDPQPQTIYHVSRKAADGLLFTISIEIRR
jgi:hypothetical protein